MTTLCSLHGPNGYDWTKLLLAIKALPWGSWTLRDQERGKLYHYIELLEWQLIISPFPKPPDLLFVIALDIPLTTIWPIQELRQHAWACLTGSFPVSATVSGNRVTGSCSSTVTDVSMEGIHPHGKLTRDAARMQSELPETHCRWKEWRGTRGVWAAAYPDLKACRASSLGRPSWDLVISAKTLRLDTSWWCWVPGNNQSGGGLGVGERTVRSLS